MENAKIQSKVKLLFEKILKPHYVMDNYYADNLFIKINNTDPEVTYFKSLPFLPQLLVDSLDGFETYDNTVKVFLIRLLAVVCDREVNFGKIFSRKGDMLAQAFNQIDGPTMNSSLRVAYMDVALSLLNHSSGVIWLYDSDAWKHILVLCNDKRTVFVVRKTYKFASKIMWELNHLGDISKITTTLEYIMKPVLDTDYFSINQMTSENEEEISKTLEPMLQMLLSIITNAEELRKGNSMLIEYIIKKSNLITLCYVLLDKLRREDLTLLITKILFAVGVARILHLQPKLINDVYEKENFIELGATYLNIIQFLIHRRSPTMVFDFCNACSVMWTTAWEGKAPAMFEADGKKFELHNQIVAMILVPSLVYANHGRPMSSSFTDERVDEFLVKLLNYMCYHTARAAYALRDLTVQLDILSITLQSVKRLSCWKNRFSNEQANLVFQALFFVLKQYDPVDDDGEMKNEITYEDSMDKVLVMTYVLDSLLSLVKTYNINWHESFEVLCLYNVVYHILKRPNLTCKFVVTALNVIAITIKKFLPPNLSLLMDSKPGSAMHELGKLIYMKLHDFHWEVRDSALELLLVCTEISFIKFPPIQKQILSNNLMTVAVTIALNDHEFYVRASALKCIGAATKVCAIWDDLKTNFPNIQHMILTIMMDNPEGIVRKEACNVFCEIYHNLRVTPAFKQVLHECMLCTALNDFHWEVQLSALRFWKIVIQHHLNAQGMLDGTFPPVTFSKDSRKIVTLNEKEIQKRLQKTLEELASIGCLTVLVKLLQDESEVDIMEAALSISMELYSVLEKYKVPETLQAGDCEMPSVDELDRPIKLTDYSNMNSEANDTAKVDNVIEGIVNADDINLLAMMYESQMKLQNDEMPVKDQPPKPKLLKFASPHLFVTFLKSKDFKAVIEQKKKWREGIKSLSSLLDDVLGIYEINDDVNSLDCY
ncbi:PREDICTED: uncharacterized protein LOC106121356 [Papilio xuthus]|uniref:Uncharacterized protein LOC106121356 n=1 Tax=Papilio xuthus TaxID=66420 RepID=A0AAJ7ED21_PAPXU|nr:PREDICTED: uncharacterized protein LOC106121356 [Papilio xuthus]